MGIGVIRRGYLNLLALAFGSLTFLHRKMSISFSVIALESLIINKELINNQSPSIIPVFVLDLVCQSSTKLGVRQFGARFTTSDNLLIRLSPHHIPQRASFVLLLRYLCWI